MESSLEVIQANKKKDLSYVHLWLYPYLSSDYSVSREGTNTYLRCFMCPLFLFVHIDWAAQLFLSRLPGEGGLLLRRLFLYPWRLLLTVRRWLLPLSACLPSCWPVWCSWGRWLSEWFGACGVGGSGWSGSGSEVRLEFRCGEEGSFSPQYCESISYRPVKPLYHLETPSSVSQFPTSSNRPFKPF